jgi:tetratricopeptide (TPR) repeat protein
VIDSPVRLVDIAPTVLDVVGHPSGISMAGTSLVDVISAGSGEDRPAYFEAMTYNLVRGWAPLRGVINGREKYIDLPIAELYDLASDAAEQHNTAPARSGRVRELHSLLRTYNVAPPNRPGQESAEAAAVLRSLGYVSGSAAPRDRYTEADDPKRLVDVDRDLHAATAAFENGQHDRGVELLESVIARRGDTADAYISLAFAHWEAGRVDAAIAALERGLRNGAPDRDIRIRLGVYLAESGANPSRAIALLEGLPATDAEAQNGLGVALTHAGRLGDAASAFRRVLVLDPTNGLALQNLASLSLRQALAVRAEPERQRLLREAEVLAERAIAADPLLPDVYTTMGVIYSSTGRPDRAIASWKRAVALDALQFNALYNLWAKLGETGPEAEAIQYGEQFVETAPPALFSQDIVRVRAWLAQRRAKR